MIKICYIIGQLGKGGAEKQLYELLKGINREMFYPSVISLSKDGYWGNEIQRLGIEIIELPRKKNFEFTRLFGLIKLLNKIKPHIVHTYMYSANSYGRIAAIISRVPIIIASERNLPEIGKDKNTYQICIDKFLSLFCDGIICNSLKASETLVKKYSFNAKNVLTVYNGINVTDFLKENSLDNPPQIALKVIGTVGRLFPQKNHKLFLDMAKIIINRCERGRIKLLIVGEGPLKNELKDYSKKLGIEDYVIFTGERGDIPKLLAGMDIFVMTSLYEGLSNSIMEAMASGLPCIVTNVGGNSELVVDGKTGYIVPANDPEVMAQKVLFLLNNEELAKEMGMAGRKRIGKEFTLEKMVKNTEEIYKNLLNKRNSSQQSFVFQGF